MKSSTLKMFLPYLLEAYTDIERAEKIISIKVNLYTLLQSAVGSGSYEQYKRYSAGIQSLPPINIRDLLEFKKINKGVDINKVEPLEEILKRFGSGSMSHGALSAEAHETLAKGMNRIKKELRAAVKEEKTLKDLKFFQTVIVLIQE